MPPFLSGHTAPGPEGGGPQQQTASCDLTFLLVILGGGDAHLTSLSQARELVLCRSF